MDDLCAECLKKDFFQMDRILLKDKYFVPYIPYRKLVFPLPAGPKINDMLIL